MQKSILDLLDELTNKNIEDDIDPEWVISIVRKAREIKVELNLD